MLHHLSVAVLSLLLLCIGSGSVAAVRVQKHEGLPEAPCWEGPVSACIEGPKAGGRLSCL